MSTKKKIMLAVLGLLVIIQFLRPERNSATELIGEKDISRKYSIPDNVHAILIRKCYDCHSNKTAYPWYTNIQPVGWWMSHHVSEGKDELNFSEFTAYPDKRANHKMEELSDAVNEGWMPIDSYTWMHGDAVITQEDKEVINAWLIGLKLPKDDH
jgi:hypothetical protein